LCPTQRMSTHDVFAARHRQKGFRRGRSQDIALISRPPHFVVVGAYRIAKLEQPQTWNGFQHNIAQLLGGDAEQIFSSQRLLSFHTGTIEYLVDAPLKPGEVDKKIRPICARCLLFPFRIATVRTRFIETVGEPTPKPAKRV